MEAGRAGTIASGIDASRLPDDYPKLERTLPRFSREQRKEFRDITFTGNFVDETNFMNAKFYNCRFRSCKFSSTVKFDGATFIDCLFDASTDLTKLDIKAKWVGRPARNSLWGADAEIEIINDE